MEIFITHLWKSAIILTIFYGFYKLLLQKETYFQSIRYFLLSGVLLSIIIPFITIVKHIEIAPISVTTNAITAITPNIETAIDWPLMGFTLYIVICFGLFIKFIFQLISIGILIYKNKSRKLNDSYLVETSSHTSPFSFFNFIVYNPNQFRQEELVQVLAHERAHVRQLHSIDNIIAHLLVIVCWFNPFAWLYKNSIIQNLEFIADEYAQQRTASQHTYQQLLLKTTVPNYQMALANNFYNSLLKKRIIMLHKQRSSSTSKWKLAIITPLLIGFVFAFNVKTVAQQKSKTKTMITMDVDIFAMVLDKSSSNSDLNKISKSFLEKGLEVDFSNIKRNTKNEITAIKISAKAKSGKASASHASSIEKGINPIQISFDEENNNLNIGSSSDHLNEYSYSTKGKGGSYVYISNDDDKNVRVTKKATKKIIVESHFDEDDDNNEDIIKITTKKTGNENKITLNSANKKKQPLFILDGKEITLKEMKAIDADTIESINVLKDKSAKDKYGKKGKNGVIEIILKK